MATNKDVEIILHHRFSDLTLLDEALTADGAREECRENARAHGNKGLALVGDALLRLIFVDDGIAAGYSTEKCHRLCKNETCNKALKRLEESLGLDKYIELDGAQRGRVSLVTGASTVEALVGAAWLDCGKDYQCLHRTVHKMGIGRILARDKGHSYD